MGAHEGTTVTQTITYDAWGVPSVSGNTDSRLMWKGLLWEGDVVALYYMRGRWYDPQLGRFIQEDPIHSGVNDYVFAGDDPINGSDPSGTDALPDFTCETFSNGNTVCINYGGGGGAGYSLPPVIVTAPAPAPAGPGNYGGNSFGQPEGGGGGGAFANGSGGSTPQAQQPANSKSYAACGLKAWKQNWKGLVLDGAGWAVVAAFPEGSLAATVAGSTLGVVGIGVAVADNRGRADGVVSGTLAYAGKQAAVVEGGFRGTAAAVSATSMIAHRFGLAALYFSTAYDTYKYMSDFNACRAGH